MRTIDKDTAFLMMDSMAFAIVQHRSDSEYYTEQDAAELSQEVRDLFISFCELEGIEAVAVNK